MYFKIIEINQDLVEKAEAFFPVEYLKTIDQKSSFLESVVARYIISRYVQRYYFSIEKYLPIVAKNGKPIFNNGVYWSISHKENFIFIGVSRSILGVDLEIFKKRDLCLLDSFSDSDYSLLGGKNWDNFYTIWTSIEAIIKYNLGNLDDKDFIKLLKISKKHKKISNNYFQKELLFSYKGKEFRVISGKKDDKFFSVCL